MIRTVLAVLGAIFLIILAVRFFPVVLAVGLSVAAIVLVVLVIAGVALVLAPLFLVLLLVAAVIWVFRLIF